MPGAARAAADRVRFRLALAEEELARERAAVATRPDADRWLARKVRELRAELRALERPTTAALSELTRELERHREFVAQAERKMGKSWVIRRWDEVDRRLGNDRG
jgi:vacuolar-type H+-ATPase subunit D/Vma8